jgi:hypothetical protein
MKTPKQTARLAGLLYLVLAAAGMFSIMYVPSQLIVSDDPAATANNIMASPMLYRAGIVGGLVCQTVFVFLVLALYKLLRHVDKMYALAMVTFVVVAVPISFVNSLNEYAVLVLLEGDEYLRVFTKEQLYAHAMIFRNLYQHGILVAEIFWGLWLFPLGYLVYKSGMFPKVFGVLLMMGCFAYLIEFSVVNFLPEYNVITIPGSIVSALAEFGFLFYLLIKGVRDDARKLSITHQPV